MKALIFLSAAVILMRIDAYPGGAPKEVCETMQPGVYQHGQGQNSPSPYTVAVDTAQYIPGVGKTVTITGGSLKGILCQARKVSGADTAGYGSFTASAGLKTLACSNGGGDSGITHSGRIDSNQVSFTWMPPESNVGDLKIRCTIVQTKNMYWMGVDSSGIMYAEVGLTDDHTGSDDNDHTDSDNGDHTDSDNSDHTDSADDGEHTDGGNDGDNGDAGDGNGAAIPLQGILVWIAMLVSLWITYQKMATEGA